MWRRFGGPAGPRRTAQASVASAIEDMKESVRALRSELASQISFQSYDLTHEIEAIKTQLTPLRELETLKGQLQELQTPLRELETLKGQLQELQSASGRAAILVDRISILDNGLNSRMNSVDTALFEVGNKLAHVEANALAKVSLDVANRIAALENAVLTRINEARNSSFEEANQLLTRQMEGQNRLYELHNKLEHLDGGLHSRLNELMFVQLPAVLEQIHEAAGIQIDALQPRVERDAPIGRRFQRPLPTQVESFEAILDRAKREFPAVYEAWRTRLDEMGAAFADTKIGNAANPADVYSRLFRSFVKRHVHGAVLDIGCGPFGRPYYLQDYPAELISGIEPLPFPPNDDIQILRGISEYLPFADGVFSTVISGTALDHCVDLQQSLDEMVRVLEPGGVVLLWIGSSPGSPEFQPGSPDFTPADRFHLFHFDVAWFEPLLGQRFETLDRVQLDRAGYSHVFYCLRPIARSQSTEGTGMETVATMTPKKGTRSSGKHTREAVGE